MIFWIDALVSITLPFIALAGFSWLLMWFVQRSPVRPGVTEEPKRRSNREKPASPVDARGNARHEWLVESEVLRLRRGEHRW
jgi:hypothetical protein